MPSHGWSCGFDFPKGLACWMGNIASILAMAVYVPQVILNYRRKSCVGFSFNSSVIKLIGSCFLLINSYFKNSPLPVFLYGFLNTAQHLIFKYQFWIYSNSRIALYFLLFPFIPYVLALFCPSTIQYTDAIKPFTQIASHVALLWKCVECRTSDGVSLFGSHLNFISGILGTIMCSILQEDLMTYLIYVNSIGQAVTLYALAIYYHEFRFCDKPRHISPPGQGDLAPLL